MRARSFVLLVVAAAACGACGKESRTQQPQPAQTQSITWPAADTVDRTAYDRLPGESQAVVPRSPVPVLVPKDPAFLAVGKIMIEPASWYAFAGAAGGVTVSVQGNAKAYDHPEISAQAADFAKTPLRRTRGNVTVNESIRTATWIENGAAYSVDVECADPTEARCASDTFVIELVNGLVYVGGGQP
jgi:hypothetical protein